MQISENQVYIDDSLRVSTKMVRFMIPRLGFVTQECSHIGNIVKIHYSLKIFYFSLLQGEYYLDIDIMRRQFLDHGVGVLMPHL